MGNKNLTVIEGGNLNIPCDCSGIPEPEVSWFKNTEPITSNINEDVSDLHFFGSKLSCILLDDLSRHRLIVFNLIVKSLPPYSRYSYEPQKFVGLTIPLLQKSLTLYSVTAMESAMYQCHCSNDIGNAQATFGVQVKGISFQ